MWKVLLVDDEPKAHALLAMLLPSEIKLVSCFTGNEALAAISREKPDLVLLDIGLPDMNGLEVLRCTGCETDRPVFIVVSGYCDTEIVVEAVKAGAAEYLVKPYRSKDMVEIIRRNLLLRADGNGARVSPSPGRDGWNLLGESAAMRTIHRQILSYAGSDGTVLITGESGTGKELVALALHEHSGRVRGPFRAVNCGAVPESLFESEMFGSERGAFTGATTRAGVFEGSNGGTLFLDEIGELPHPVQVKLLRVLEDKQVMHLGSLRTMSVDVRIIAATNRDLRESVREGHFRSDLFYRLNVLHIGIPPLRDRREDIPLLCYAFLRDFNGRNGVQKYLLSPSLRKLMEYPWPGNVRELRNVINRAYYLCDEDRILPDHIQFE